jgi:5-formyltetrahydrofolate cyclo-ligase
MYQVDTRPIFEEAFARGKRCFVPRCIELDAPGLMVMLEVYSLEDLDNLPRNKWGIPEPPVDDGRDDALCFASKANDEKLGCIVMPGK